MKILIIIVLIIIIAYLGFKCGVFVFEKRSYKSNVQSIIDSLKNEYNRLIVQEQTEEIKTRITEVKNILSKFNVTI